MTCKTQFCGVFCAVIIPALFLSCAAGTTMTSLSKPGIEKQKYKRVLVITSFNDLELQKAAEEKLVGGFLSHNVECLLETQFFLPGDGHTTEDLIKVIDDNGVDALLSIIPGTSGTSQTYVPRTTTSSTSGHGRVDSFGNVTYNSKSKTNEYGGYNIDKPWARFEANLLDAKTGQKVWVASATTKGNGFANWKTVVRSMCGQTVSKLADDGLIEE